MMWSDLLLTFATLLVARGCVVAAPREWFWEYRSWAFPGMPRYNSPPKKVPLPVGVWAHTSTGFYGPREFTPQTEVDRFSRFCRTRVPWPADRQIDRPRWMRNTSRILSPWANLPLTYLRCTRIKVDKKLSYRRGTARCVVSVEILSIATQQCRNYLYDKSWTHRSYEVGGLRWADV